MNLTPKQESALFALVCILGTIVSLFILYLARVPAL